MDPALQTMIDNMPEKTGKSLAEWKKLLATKTFAKHSAAVNYLKKEHGVTHGFANTIVTLAKDAGDSPTELIDQQYQGKEALRPIYDRLIAAVRPFGEDVTITPKKTTVSLIRSKPLSSREGLGRGLQFALIKPATKTRIDLGLKLPGKGLTERLENSGPFGTMCTHRVRLGDPGEVDAELRAWLREAYDMAG